MSRLTLKIKILYHTQRALLHTRAVRNGSPGRRDRGIMKYIIVNYTVINDFTCDCDSAHDLTEIKDRLLKYDMKLEDL